MPESFIGQESGEREDSHGRKILHVGKLVYSGCVCGCACVCVCVDTHTIKQIYLICKIFSKHLLCTRHTDSRTRGEKMIDTFPILKFLTT